MLTADDVAVVRAELLLRMDALLLTVHDDLSRRFAADDVAILAFVIRQEVLAQLDALIAQALRVH
jgi:hypothetical protein